MSSEFKVFSDVVMKESIVAEKSFAFALKVISLYKELIKENEYVMSKQILRSATSIGANIQEALAGVSRKDFSYKMSIASKEARETRYWLMLLDKSQYIKKDYTLYLIDIDELIKILTSIVKRLMKNMANNNSELDFKFDAVPTHNSRLITQD
ncbi:MAG: four helix bundle protein [Cyclobacteriaceae bacterium]